MKKVISVLLLLAMVLGCFAGCKAKVEEDAALNSAKEYLYAMYKDAKVTTDADYTVVGQVRIDDVTYPITWTSNAPAENVKISAGENNMVTVEINAGAEDINYKLTATLKNDKGQEASVSFDHTIPAKAQVGGTIALAYPAENKYITGEHYLYTSSSGSSKYELVLSENKADALAMEVIENGDDTVSFKAGNMYLFCDATHVKFVEAQDDNTKFVLEAADTNGGYFIKCAVANYNGKPQYLEVYKGYLTCYGMGDPTIYTFKLEDATGAAGTISGLEAAPAPDTTPDPAPSTPAPTTPPATQPKPTTPPATQPKPTTPANPPAVSGNAITFDFSSLSQQGVEIAEDQALAVFNGAASGTGLTAAVLTKVYDGNGTGGAHPNGTGFLKCGTGKVDGALELTFGKKVAKVEIFCHDWYAKSDNYPTNTNAVSVNGSATQLAPYNETGAMGSLTFNLGTASETVSIALSNSKSGQFGRAFISKIIVTFA